MKPGCATHHARRSTRLRRGRGFTLIEAALTTVIIGTGVLAIVAAQQAYHRKNNWAQRTGTAMMLANEMRELMVYLEMRESGAAAPGPDSLEDPDDIRTFDDVDDFIETIDASSGVGTSRLFSPPISATGQEIPDMDGWAQQIKIKAVDASDIDAIETTLVYELMHPDAVLRVTADVYYEEELISSMSWLVTPRLQ